MIQFLQWQIPTILERQFPTLEIQRAHRVLTHRDMKGDSKAGHGPWWSTFSATWWSRRYFEWPEKKVRACGKDLNSCSSPIFWKRRGAEGVLQTSYFRPKESGSWVYAPLLNLPGLVHSLFFCVCNVCLQPHCTTLVAIMHTRSMYPLLPYG